MAVLRKLPSQGIIDLMAGTLDFYVYHPVTCQGEGIPCVRTWPRYDETHMTQASIDQRAAFGYVNTMWRDLSIEVQEAWNDLAGQSSKTGKDLAIRGYINGDTL
ncbi:hypothetical protein ES703_45029 [subsurface metagenome]